MGPFWAHFDPKISDQSFVKSNKKVKLKVELMFLKLIHLFEKTFVLVLM